MKFTMLLKTFFTFILIFSFTNNTFAQEKELVFEEVIVTAEKRDESLQTISQAVTAITDSEIDAKNINSFVTGHTLGCAVKL